MDACKILLFSCPTLGTNTILLISCSHGKMVRVADENWNYDNLFSNHHFTFHNYVLLNGNHFVQPADLAKPCIEEYINYLKDPAQSGVLDAQCLGHPTCVKEVKGSTLKIFSDLPSPIAKQLSLHHFVFHTKLLLITLLCRTTKQ